MAALEGLAVEAAELRHRGCGQDEVREQQEAARVLKPGGKLLVSFLEFRHPGLWPIFEASIPEVLSGGRLDTFVDRHALRLWSNHAGFDDVTFIDGENPHIPIDREIEFDNGVRVSSISRLGPTGQSIMICHKKG